MLLQAYVKVSLLLGAAPAALDRRMRVRRDEDTGLATLEWVALVIIALGLATAAGYALNLVLKAKIDQIK